MPSDPLSNLVSNPLMAAAGGALAAAQEEGMGAVERKMTELLTGAGLGLRTLTSAALDPTHPQKVLPYLQHRSGLSQAAQAALYQVSSGGSRTRARIGWSACLSLGVAREDALLLCAVVELLHNASLVHDDLQDQATERRGCEAVWVKFSPAVAICAGDYMISSAYGALSHFSQPRLLPALLRAMHRCVSAAIDGQCDDLRGAEMLNACGGWAAGTTASASRGLAGVESYAEVVKAKSGALLSLPLELALIASENFQALTWARRAAEDFAVGYQIRDDLVDLKQDQAQEGKPASLNLYEWILRQGSEQQALEQVKALARSYFASAEAMARDLPGHSGQYLQSLAREMSIF